MKSVIVILLLALASSSARSQAFTGRTANNALFLRYTDTTGVAPVIGNNTVAIIFRVADSTFYWWTNVRKTWSPYSSSSRLSSRTVVADANYTLLPTDNTIAYTSLTAARTATLPSATSYTNKIYIIKDESGNAGTSNITIATTSSQTIDGASTKVISTAYGLVKVYSNGSNWFTY